MDLLTFAGACALVFAGLSGGGPAWQQDCLRAAAGLSGGGPAWQQDCLRAAPSFAAELPALPPSWTASSLDRWDGYIAEAATRFGLPEDWIRNVMQAESGGEPASTSPAGAMGLMQVMPDTYDDLRQRYGLGRDPYDPRDNILAGAAYLREMYELFGASGFLAAYNAGPQRLADHLATARPLPLETRRYVAPLAPKIAQSPAQNASPSRAADEWTTIVSPTPPAPVPMPIPPRIEAAPAPPIPDGGSLFFIVKKPAMAPSDHTRSGAATVKSNP